MKKLIFLIFLSTNVLAATVSARGQFTSRPGDPLSFIKRQLYSNTVRNVLDSELKKLGLDTKTFWTNYETKFDEHFNTIKENFDKDFGAVDAEGNPVELSAKKKERYQKSLRFKKLNAQAKYGGFNKIIQSYSIKKMSKSLSQADTHYIRVDAKVNRKLVSEIYYRFIGQGQKRNLTKLYLNINYKLNDLSWEEVGVSSSTQFTDVVEEHWLQELTKSTGELFLDGIEVLNPSMKSEIFEHLKKPLSVLRSSNEEMFGSRQNELKNSLMLTIDIVLSKQYKDENKKNITIQTYGGIVLTDLRDGTIVTFEDFKSKSKEYSTEDPHKQSSSIASFVYQLPVSKMSQLKRTVKEKVSVKNSFDIVLKNTKNINEAFKFASDLKEEGVVYFFEPEVTSTIRNDVNLSITFSGDKDKAVEILEKFKNYKLNDDATITRDENLPFVFNITRSDSEVEKKTDNAKGTNL